MPDFKPVIDLWNTFGTWIEFVLGIIIIVTLTMLGFYVRRAVQNEDDRRKSVNARLMEIEGSILQVERKEQADEREKHIRRDIQTQRTQDTLYLQRVMDELKMNHREIKQEFLIEIREQRAELKKQNDYMHETNRKIDLLIHRDKQSRAGDRIDAGREGSKDDRRSDRAGSKEDRRDPHITPDI